MKNIILIVALFSYSFSYSQYSADEYKSIIYSQFLDITKLDWRNLYGDDAYSYYNAFQSAVDEEDWELAYGNLSVLNELPELDYEYSVRVALCFYLGEIAADKFKRMDWAKSWYNDALENHKGLIDEETGYSSKATILMQLTRVINSGENGELSELYYDEAIREIKKNKKLYSDRYKALAYSNRAWFRYVYKRKGVCKDVKKTLKYDDKYKLERELSQMGCD